MHINFSILLGALLVCLAAAWTTEDHEIFRLHDDVKATEGANATFYSFVGVSRKATLDEINKAYRKRASKLHPDKARQVFIANYGRPTSVADKKKGPKVHAKPSQREIDSYHKAASERFARLGVVTNILRGPDRERYDHFLDYGFPKWRGTGYYYQRYRPGLGTVLVGLFIVMGGAAHYGAMIVGWRRQREFAERYIRDARKLAWGNSTLFVPGLDTAAPAKANGNGNANADATASANDGMNRRQKRAQEKENKRNAKRGITTEDISEPSEPTLISGPQGSKRRVVAENGKTLIVDSVGNVFLEETTEDGVTHEYLIDVDEIPKPSIYDTILFRLPIWAYRQSLGRVLGKQEVDPPELDEDELNQDDSVDAAIHSATAINPNGEAKRRKAKARRQ